MEENNVMVVETTESENANKLTTGEKIGVGTLVVLAGVGIVETVRFGIKQGKKVVKKIRKSKAGKGLEDRVDKAKQKVSEKKKSKEKEE